MRLLTVGKVINTHGVRGELKIHRISDFDERFTVGNTLYLVNKAAEKECVTVKKHRIHKGFDLVQFEEITDLTRAETYKNYELCVSEEQLTPLGEDEFYYYEIIGLTVQTTDGQILGTVTEIMSPGANDVWVVQTTENKEVLIPYIKEVVKQVNLLDKLVTIELMEGLLD